MLVVAPAQQRVDDEGVLHVDEHADRRIHARERLDGQHRVEERRACPAVALGNLDAHHAQLEQLVDQRARDLGVLIHLADQRPDLPVGELVHAVAKDDFVFGETSQRAARAERRFSRLKHAETPEIRRKRPSSGQGSSKEGMLSSAQEPAVSSRPTVSGEVGGSSDA